MCSRKLRGCTLKAQAPPAATVIVSKWRAEGGAAAGCKRIGLEPFHRDAGLQSFHGALTQRYRCATRTCLVVCGCASFQAPKNATDCP